MWKYKEIIDHHLNIKPESKKPNMCKVISNMLL
jgi:hypothetical protein